MLIACKWFKTWLHVQRVHYNLLTWLGINELSRVLDIAVTNNIQYNDIIMTTMASQITSLAVVYSTVYSDADQRKHQSSASLALCGNSPGPVNSPHKGPVTRKKFPFDDVIILTYCALENTYAITFVRRLILCKCYRIIKGEWLINVSNRRKNKTWFKEENNIKTISWAIY